MSFVLHPQALADPSAVVGDDTVIGPFAVVEPGAVIGAHCVLEPFCRVGSHVRLGDGVRVGQGAALGGLPQITGFRPEDGGCCVIGDGCRLGEFVTVHAASSPEGGTMVGRDAFIMAYAHVAHDCRVGERAILANAVQLGGFVTVDRGAFIGGAAAIHQHCLVGEYAFVGGNIPVGEDILPWSRVLGLPNAWAKLNLVGLRRAGWTPEMLREAGHLLHILLREGMRLEEARSLIAARPGELAARLTDFLQRSRRGLVRPRH